MSQSGRSGRSGTSFADLTIHDSGSDGALPPYSRTMKPWNQVDRVKAPTGGDWTPHSDGLCRFDAKHTVYYLDPHDTCNTCRARGKGTKCNWGSRHCVLCLGMQPWALLACQLDRRQAKLQASRLRAEKSKKGAGKTVPCAAVGSARLAQLDSDKSSAGSKIPPVSEKIPTVQGSAADPSETLPVCDLTLAEEDALLQLPEAEKRQSTREGATAGHAASLIDPESLEISVGIETDLAATMMDVSIDPIKSANSRPTEKPWTRTLIDLDTYRARRHDPRAERDPRSEAAPPPTTLTLDMLMAALDKQGDQMQARVDLTLKAFMDKATKDRKVEHEARRKRRYSSSDESSHEGDGHSDGSPSDGDHSSVPSCTVGVAAAGSAGAKAPPAQCPMDFTESGRQPTVTYPVHDRGSGVDTSSLPAASAEQSQFDQAKARIADVLPACAIRRPVLEDEGDLFLSDLPQRLDSNSVEGPPTLPVSASMRRAYEVLNQQLRGTPDVPFTLEEQYDPVELLKPLPDSARPLRRGAIIPVHPKLGFRKHDFHLEYHGTAMTWPTKSPSDLVASLGQDAQNVGAGLSFLEQSIGTILSAVAQAEEAGGPGALARVVETIAEVAPAMQRTLCRTSYHAARGHVNSLLHARSKTNESDTVVAEAIWTAPAELGTNLDAFRAEASEQVREVRRRSLVDNILLSNETAATKATKGGSHGDRHGDSRTQARKRRRKNASIHSSSKTASAASSTAPPAAPKKGPSGSHAPKTGNKAYKPKRARGKREPEGSSRKTSGRGSQSGV